MLPTGQIAAQDSTALKSVVEAANAIDGPDILAPLPVSTKWLSDTTSRRQLIAGARRIRHTVALGLVDGNGDPMGAKGVADGYREFLSRCPAPSPGARTCPGWGQSRAALRAW